MTDNLMHILQSGHHSLVVANRETRTFNGRGVYDLYNLLTEVPGYLQGASVADKVVGKGAAALMILGSIREVYTGVISRSALDLLREAGIKVEYAQCVPHIINRKGDGICPLETLCRDCKTAAECLPLIKEFVTKNNPI